ncbi:GTPase HflX [soil metagenome]
MAATLGLEVVGRVEQNRRDGAGYIGKGKREELAEMVSSCAAHMIISDDELTASQARVLERDSGASVVDRTELIIRIFETNARDSASRLGVELADLEYRLPRVKGRNPELSRLGGGTGGGRVTRGPGEQQLEYDRRAIRRRIEAINRKLSGERESRAVKGARLSKDSTPIVALVGYTNAGKTTVLNSLSGTTRSTADRLFETLETTTRLVQTPSNSSQGSSKPDFVVIDTVGFIRKLPTQLVHSFSSTLEAATRADIVVICADASSEVLPEEISTTMDAISSSGDQDSQFETMLCLNKIDLLSSEDLTKLKYNYPSAVFISSIQNTDELLIHIHESIDARRQRIQLLIPHEDYGRVSRLYGKAEIHDSKNTEKGTWLDVSLPVSIKGQYHQYAVSR